MDFSKTSFENKVEARIELETTGQEEGPVEDKVTTNTDFRTEVTVTKVWNHTNNIYTIPIQVKLQVKNGNSIVKEQVVNTNNKVENDANTWSYTFTGLPKYDAQGRLITYTVDEAEVNSGDLAYYDKQISGKTITNTYAGPIISSTKDSTTEKGLEYVVEGEKITYTITVKNNGSRDKVVKVQDSAPEGTTFVAGSIKVNGSGANNYTETNLNSGIDVNIPAHGKASISFEVTVKPLQGDNLTKEIRNTATVDGKPTGEITNTVNKANVIAHKTAVPANGNVVEGQTITYTITLDNSTGTAPADVTVKDTVPTGTSFIRGSVEIDGEEKPEITQSQLTNGISVQINAGETKTVKFKVTVQDQANESKIRNTATVNDVPTETTEHTYAKPIISATKTSTILDVEGRNYALEGDKIKYTITVKNDGGLSKNVKIQDAIPEGTTFIEGSISGHTSSTQTDLTNGITVNVPAKGQVSLSFEVRVNNLAQNEFTKTITNQATVDNNNTNKVTTTVNKPDVQISKASNPPSGEDVIKDQQITYTIKLDNSKGTAPDTVTVKDPIPTGTTYVDRSLKVNNIETQGDISKGIVVSLNAGETKTIEFKVKVQDLNNGNQISNKATMGDKESNTITHKYVEPIIKQEKVSTTENHLSYVVEGEKITYTIDIINEGDLGKTVSVVDQTPEGTGFVKGSIKENGVSKPEYDENSLKSGINVEVPKRGKVTVSFEVIVNELQGTNLTKTITNQATVDGNLTNQVSNIVNKADLKFTKSANPPDGSNVKKDDIITYTINLDNSRGTAPTQVSVQDTIPTGTTYVTDSLKIEGVPYTGNIEEGIQVSLNAGETKNIEFKVKVGDLKDEQEITNIAKVENVDTNPITHTYIEPIITQHKEATLATNAGYSQEGEKIIYTITVTNAGHLDKNVTIVDNIPAGTTFVENSIKVNNEVRKEYNQASLTSGINLNVPATDEITLSFEVTVDELEEGNYTEKITNIATVDGNNTNTRSSVVNKPNVVISKTADPVNGNVVEGQIITYTIKLDNSTGKAPEDVIVKDTVPTGTTFVTGSVKVGGVSTQDREENLRDGITVHLNAGETKTVEFKVKVQNQANGSKIKNTATVNDEQTGTTEHTYIKPIISATKISEILNAEGRNYALEGDKIIYTITVKNEGDLGKEVTIIDNIPSGTRFVEGSIKISNKSNTESLGKDELEDGITVNIPARGEETLTFEVEVENLPEGKLTDTIKNVAIVDDKETETVTDTVKKPNAIAHKTANPENGTVVEGQIITYTITLDNSTGTAPADVIVKDTVPTGTTFVTGSVKVGGASTQDTEENLRNGITVHLNAGETKTVEFKVKVQNQANESKIRNTATVNDVPTETIEHTYVEPVISSQKTSEILNVTGRDYALEGEKIKYTITVTNNGGLSGDATITDTIPEGTTFVPGSIKVNGVTLEEDNTEAKLNSGIKVNVPAKEGSTAGTTSLSFEVTVDEIKESYQYTIENTAHVTGKEYDEDVPSEDIEVKKPNITTTKESDPASGEKVEAGEEITYTIVLDNTQGTAPGTVKVKDTMPAGTTYKENSIMLDGVPVENDNTDLANGLNVTVPAGKTRRLSFTVTVKAKEELTDGYIITNQATVGEGEEPNTNEVEHTYVEPVISSKKTSEILNVTGRDYALEGETIKYTITVTNNGGLSGDATITDEIPTGTTFVDGSIKVNGVTLEEDNTETKLNSGIKVNVPAKEGSTAGTTSLSFEVTVDEIEESYQYIIENTAHVTGSEYDQDVPSEDVEVKKPHIVANKTSDPVSGTQVTQGEEITYYIYVNNDGTAPTTVTVKDEIPEGTTFVENSIKLEGSGTYGLEDLTTNGIEIELNSKEDKTVEFTVTVNDLNNGADITNIATVDDEQTNTVTHKYVEAIIDANKTATIEHPEVGYVLEGETITYTITVTNTGDLAKRVTVKDVIPTGTSFVENSVKIDNQEQTYTQTDLQNGINVDVPAQGNVVVTFEVTVNELAPDTYEGTITNKANVDGKDTNEVTEEVKKPHVTGTKTSTPASGSTVKLNDPIKYVITLTNDGTAPETVTVRDEIPAGTTFTDGSIKVQGDSKTYTIDDLTTYGINVTVPEKETRTVEFTVTVNDLDNGDKITNIAYVEGEETDPVEHTYVEAIIDGSKASETANGLDYVVEGEVITYTITATNTGDLDKNITISDQIPAGTTFVEESIRVNGQDRTDLGQTNLESGIQVNVPARTSEEEAGTATVSFQVTVNPLADGELVKQIRKHSNC